MQLQGLMLMLFMLVVFPVVILFADHDIYFVLMAFILLVVSIKNIHTVLFHPGQVSLGTNEESGEELEDMMNVDIKKFGIGTKVSRNLFIILFFLYCAFYIHTLVLKILLAIIILFRLHSTLSDIKENGARENKERSMSGNFFMILINVCNIIIIAVVALNKFVSEGRFL